MSFIPLHIYSGFSYLQSGLPVERIPLLAKKLSYSHVGICDNGSLSGISPFYHLCEKYGVKPIIGMDCKTKMGTFSLFVENETGYRNLLPLTYLSSQGLLTYEDIAKHAEGLTCVYPFEESFFFGHYSSMTKEEILTLERLLAPFKHHYLGLPYDLDQVRLVEFIREFAKNHSYEVVAFPKILYIKKKDAL
ncbi:MAG: PHP domain-containing protein, partial [Bacilli bacterium]|nr:PHP domain-containing protein [Bacilli bacterium]